MKYRVWLIVFWVSLSGCDASPTDVSGLLNVVTTTTILGDVVDVIGGDQINLTILLPTDTDPHSFQPTPRDMAGGLSG
jgi:ABC-type Zn uptake system ZnuABC Zn-binding protein ZnuA